MNTTLSATILVIVVVLIWVGLVTLVLRGWRNRARRQAEAVGQLPPTPTDLGEQLIGPHSGLYVGATLAPSWQNRVAVDDIGDRASSTLNGFRDGILIERSGASSLWIPRASMTAVRTERGLAGKVMTADGVLVIRWALPTGTEIDMGVRADDKTIYPAWIAEYATSTSAGLNPETPGSEQGSGPENTSATVTTKDTE